MAEFEGMSQAARSVTHTQSAERRAQPMFDYAGWVGWTLFAAVILILVGAFHVIQGLVALFKDDYYVVGSSGLVLNVSYTAWGWIHIVGGVIVVAAGIALLSGKMWARVLGTAMACVSAIVNVGFLSAYPIWSAMVIAMDIVIIMALTVHGSAIQDA
jgi:hypothetical protein